MNAWVRARPWWQELLIMWLLLTVMVLLGDVFDFVALGSPSMLPRNVFDPPVAALVMAVIFTAVQRLKRRRRDSQSDAG